MAEITRQIKIKIDEEVVKRLEDAVSEASKKADEFERAVWRAREALYAMRDALTVVSEPPDDSP